MITGCHLNINIENIIIHNVRFTESADGLLIIDRNIMLKLVGFGVSQLFLEQTKDETFECNKCHLSLKYEQYLAPNIHDSDHYDAKAADMWSFGMIIYYCFFNRYPWKTKHYDRPKIGTANYAIHHGKLRQYLLKGGLFRIINSSIFSLLNGCLDMDESNRLSAIGVIQHKWFQSYYSRYWKQLQIY